MLVAVWVFAVWWRSSLSKKIEDGMALESWGISQTQKSPLFSLAI
jgi:hypothetical protein